MSENFGLVWQENPELRDLQKLKLERIKAGQRVYDLGMVNPDLEPARFLVDRLQEAVAKKMAHRYSVARGVLKLREALALRYNQKFSVNLCPEREICITAGAKDALVQALFVLSSWAEEILLPSPCYPSFQSATVLVDKPYSIYQFGADLDQNLSNIENKLRSGRRTVLIVNFPNNPTGLSVGADFYGKLASICQKYEVRVINDFAYGEIAYTSQPETSLLKIDYFKEHGLEIYSMSKSFSIPGWRVGAVCGAAALIAELAQLKSQTDFGLFLPVQWASAAALVATDDFAGAVSKEYAARFELVRRILTTQGFEVQAATAGCSVWAKLPTSLGLLAPEFSRVVLESSGVFVMPGSVFGAEYNQWVRLALVRSQADLQEALKNWLPGQ